MRLLCINNDGCPELEVGGRYTLLDMNCPKCGGFILSEIRNLKSNALDGAPNWRCDRCNSIWAKTNTNVFVSYKEERFIAIDDLTEIEQQEYSTELENA